MNTGITYKQNIPYYKGMPCFVNGMRLNSHPYIDKDGFLSAFYWRDGGLWGITIIEIYPGVFVYNNASFEHLYLNEVTPMTFDEWKKDNGEYSDWASNTVEALTKTGYEGHEGVGMG